MKGERKKAHVSVAALHLRSCSYPIGFVHLLRTSEGEGGFLETLRKEPRGKGGQGTGIRFFKYIFFKLFFKSIALFVIGGFTALRRKFGKRYRPRKNQVLFLSRLFVPGINEASWLMAEL